MADVVQDCIEKYICKDDSVKNEFFKICTFLWVTFQDDTTVI